MSSRRVCVVGAGPSGMSVVFQFGQMENGDKPEIVCYEKQSTWGGLWNYTWRTGSDEFGEPCHGGMYRHLWSNSPKEVIEFPDYTFQQHFRRNMPSYAPRAVLRDYLEPNTTTVETFTHVVVATGIFNVPNIPEFAGLSSFEGRIIHSHDFRNAKEFAGKRLLVVGASYSADDIAMQCLKFGAKNVTCTWRTKPMGLKWPEGIEERPLVQKFEANKAHFKDGSEAEYDAVILCTGYKISFPFMEESLRLKSHLTMYPDNLYKGSVWTKGGNNKLFYIGAQNQMYTFTMFDVQALWICRYIVGSLKDEPRSAGEMKADVANWIARCLNVKNTFDAADFQTSFVAEFCAATGYTTDILKTKSVLHLWLKSRLDDITTFRNLSYSSNFTESKSPIPATKWMDALDDKMEAFLK